jgi:GT2 family glycosyltransferase
VALTNYNGDDHLRRLIPELTPHGFDHVYVLDDASTDGSVAYLTGLARPSDITLIQAETNLGPTGNRNRILDTDTRDIILFMDVDVELTDTSTAAAVEREFGENPGAGAIGGLITTPDGQPEPRCWGYDFTPFRAGIVGTLYEMACRHCDDPRVMATLCRIAEGKAAFLEPLVARDVEWARETFFAVRADVFRELGGFDPKFRMFHEGPDLCRRIRQAGWTVRFVPGIHVKHHDIRTGTPEQRAAYERESDNYYFQKHYGLSADQLALLMR